jgi:hypothetical protein
MGAMVAMRYILCGAKEVLLIAPGEKEVQGNTLRVLASSIRVDYDIA